VNQPIKTKSAVHQIKARRIAAIARKAGQLANSNRKQGYH
jgi:hypothetical protein